MNTGFDVIVIGAGAAGLMAAATAGSRRRRVLLLDHANEAGKKILISGGGRCNFTNRYTAPDRFFSDNTHFAKSALARYTQDDFVALVARHGIASHEKTLGQLFCDGSARAIVAMLLAECDAAGVDLRLAHKITGLGRADRFTVDTDRGSFTAEALVLATGGLSIPKLGATGFAYDAARQFGLPLTEIRPALVPLVANDDDLALMRPLSGVALPVEASCGRHQFREAMLFTHRGLSGPVILQISSAWHEGRPITLDLLPDLDAATVLRTQKMQRPKAGLRTILGTLLPQRLAEALASRWPDGPITLDLLPDLDAAAVLRTQKVQRPKAGLRTILGTLLPQRLAEALASRWPDGPIAGMQDRELARLATGLKAWLVQPHGSEGYAKAEVTLGGVATSALSSKTMQATAVPGLFVIGEAVDVTGWLGGYNFQWAWSSGWCAGMAA